MQVDIRILELLSARLCHELISPVGAIANGVELLGEEDPEFVRDAVALIGQSAKKAGQRLQFYRFAYGTLASGSAGPDPRELLAGLLDGGKVAAEWGPGTTSLATEWLKLACNLAVLAAEALPRGGVVRLESASSGGPRLLVEGAGDTVNLPAETRAALDPGAAVDQLTSRTVHGYVTAHLAARLGGRLAVAAEAGRLRLEVAEG